MKNLSSFILFLCFFISATTFGQEELYKDTFIRVFDLEGKKIHKGKISAISDTSLTLLLKGETTEIPVSTIGKIKTKRSGGHNVATGALIGAGSLALIGVLDGDSGPGIISLTAVDKGILGLIAGGIAGSAVGGITILFKNPKVYIINGSEDNLSYFARDNEIIF